MPLASYSLFEQTRSELIDLHVAVLGHDGEPLVQLCLYQWANLFAAQTHEKKLPRVSACTERGSEHAFREEGAAWQGPARRMVDEDMALLCGGDERTSDRSCRREFAMSRPSF